MILLLMNAPMCKIVEQSEHYYGDIAYQRIGGYQTWRQLNSGIGIDGQFQFRNWNWNCFLEK